MHLQGKMRRQRWEWRDRAHASRWPATTGCNKCWGKAPNFPEYLRWIESRSFASSRNSSYPWPMATNNQSTAEAQHWQNSCKLLIAQTCRKHVVTCFSIMFFFHFFSSLHNLLTVFQDFHLPWTHLFSPEPRPRLPARQCIFPVGTRGHTEQEARNHRGKDHQLGRRDQRDATLRNSKTRGDGTQWHINSVHVHWYIHTK